MIDYYHPRWAMFVSHVTGALSNGTEFNPEAFKTEVFQFEQDWQHDTKVYPTSPIGDTLKIVGNLHAKYFNKN